jgi:curved DNA-binding protein CbpA
MAAARNHYDVLNVARDAEPVVIEAAYRALMKKYHPDQGAATEPGRSGPSAADINSAFAVLRDPQRRAEYDHREWTRSQAIQLAQYHQYQPLPPAARRITVFGWGGWLVSALLAAALAVVAGHSGGVAPLAAVETLKAAKAQRPDFRSQPIGPEESLVSPAEAAEIRADAFAPRTRTAVRPAPTETARLRIEPVPAETVPLRAAPVPFLRVTRERAAPRRRGEASKLASKDFVERHGGIY